jgi:hypothetical protein
MTTAADLIAQALAKRERWVDLGNGRRVRMRRPPELEMARMRGGVEMEKVAAMATAWEGVTMADVLGEGESPVEFDAELWRLLVTDNAEWAAACAATIVDMMSEHMAQRETTRGN